MIRKLLTIAAALFAAVGFATPGQSQEWPQATIRIIIAFGPGGGTDIVGRILAQRMQEKLGQSVVVENRPGAGGILGNDAVARAAKDGYTLGIMTAGQTIAAVLRKSMPYDQLTAFDSIGQIAAAGFVIVARSDFPADNVKDLIAAAKANPGKLSIAAPGLWRHPAHGRGAVQPSRRHQCAERAVPHHARSGRRIDRQAGGRAVRYRAGRARPDSVRPAQGDRGHRQGSVPGGADRAGRHRVRRGAWLRRHHLVRLFRTARHAARCHRQAQQDAQRNPCGARGARTPDQSRRGRTKLDARRIRQAHGETSSPAGTRCAKPPACRSNRRCATRIERKWPRACGAIHVHCITLETMR